MSFGIHIFTCDWLDAYLSIEIKRRLFVLIMTTREENEILDGQSHFLLALL